MTCKDCIHHDPCFEYGNILDPLGGGVKCDSFKNKADFVEVVRCKNCKYGDVSTFSKTIDGQEEIACYCDLKEAVTDIDWYCPNGIRK